MGSDEAVIGCTGTLVHATRGKAGPGEVVVRVRGGRETLLAWSEEPLPKGATVLVVSSRGAMAVDVMEWDEPENSPLMEAG